MVPLSNPKKYVRVAITEEKGSDVNIATHLINDGWKDLYDVAIVVSNDSDLIEPIRIVKSELKRKGIGYKELAQKLEEIGVGDTERNIANKLARGTFTAVFFVQCLTAIGCNSLDLR